MGFTVQAAQSEFWMRLDDIKTRWLQEAPRAIADVIRAHPREEIYAAAFHLFYADYTVIHAPSLAANAESAVALHSNNSGITYSTRWMPPEWRWDVLESASEALNPLYGKQSQALQGAADDEWESVIDAHDDMIADVARTITAAARARQGDFRDMVVSTNFVVAILEGQRETSEYNRLVRTSIDPAILPGLEGILLEVSGADK